MAKGFGLAGLIIAIIGAFTPVIGLFIGIVALGIAAIGALAGDRGLAIATTVISAVVFFFLTPSLWIAEIGSAALERSPIARYLALSALAVPIVCIILKRHNHDNA